MGESINPKILLVRHGRSAHVHRGWIDADGLHRWMAAYDTAGIAEDDTPPAALQAAARQAGVLVCSDLLRARASAEALAAGRPFTASALLREAALQVPAGIGCKLPLTGWALAIFIQWIRARARGEGPPIEESRRALEAADWLERLASAEGDVVAVTHATFRGLIATALAARGWHCEIRLRRYHHWSVWSFVREQG